LVVALSIGAFVLCGALGGVLMPLLFSDFARNGIGALAKVSMLPILMLVAWVFAGLMLGAWSFARQLVSSHRLARYVSASTVEAPNTLLRAAARGGQDVRLVLVDAPESFSFVYGMLTPRVAVSRGLIEAVSADELSAVIEHERYHMRNLDPLKLVLARSLSAALFFLPALSALRARYITDCELAADRQAVARYGDRSLAGALVKVIRGPSWSELKVAASIGGPDLLDIRVAQLESGVEPKLAGIGLRGLGLSVLSVIFFTATYIVSVHCFGGPAAVHQATGTRLASATLLDGFVCAVPFAVVGLSLYLLIAARARRFAS
jgi:beta-lactamase regulating signal transducer with metallopeptidase domain